MPLARKTLGALCTAALLLAGGTASAGDVVTIGIFPRKPATETRVAFEPIATRLSAVTGKKFEIRLFHDYEAFWGAVKRRELDLVHYNQYQYLKSHKDLGYDVILVSKEAGSATMSAAIAVRKDSGFRSLADLKGKKILFGGNKQSMNGYIAQVQLLRKAGLRDGDYEEAFAVSTPNALIGTFNKAADAAGIGDHLIELPSMKAKVDVTQLTILGKGEPLPGLCWAVAAKVDPGLAKAIAKAMVELESDAGGRALLKGAEVSGFVHASDKDFDPVRRVVKDVLGEQY